MGSEKLRGEGMNILKTLAVLFLLFSPALVSAADFVHPLDFKGTQAEKDQVVAYIEETVKDSLGGLGMDDNPSMLRMMEKDNLSNFKRLMKVEDREILDAVIEQICGIGLCQYNMIFMMYNQQLKASKESLSF